MPSTSDMKTFLNIPIVSPEESKPTVSVTNILDHAMRYAMRYET